MDYSRGANFAVPEKGSLLTMFGKVFRKLRAIYMYHDPSVGYDFEWAGRDSFRYKEGTHAILLYFEIEIPQKTMYLYVPYSLKWCAPYEGEIITPVHAALILERIRFWREKAGFKTVVEHFQLE